MLHAALLTALACADIQVDCLAPSPTGALVAIALADAHIAIVDLVTGEQRARLDCAGRVNELIWCGEDLVSVVLDDHATSRSIDAASGSRTFESWDLSSGRSVATRINPPSDVCWRSIPSPDGTLLLAPACDGDAHILSVKTLKDVASAAGPFSCGCWSPDGKRVFLGGNDGMVTEVDARSGDIVHIESVGMRAVRCIALDPEEKRLVAAGQDQIARVVDPSTWKHTATWVSKTDFPMELNGFERIVLSPSGDVAYLSTTDWWSIQAWSLETNTCLWWVDFDGGNPWPVELLLSPDGSRLAYRWRDTPQILDTLDGKVCAAFAIESCIVDPLCAWNADGRFFVIRSADRTRVTVHGGRALIPLYDLTPSPSGVTKRSFLVAR